VCCSRLKSAIGAACQSRDFAEGLLANWIVTLLEHENRDTAQRELAGPRTESVHRFFHCIADEHKRSYFTSIVLTPCMRKNLRDLRLPAPTIDA
jgi:hypothetical protein